MPPDMHNPYIKVNSQNLSSTCPVIPKDPGNKRPRNAWIIFLSAKTKQIQVPEIPGEDSKERLGRMSKLVSSMWKAASRSEKQRRAMAAEEEKENHLRLYPDYKFQLCPKGGKKPKSNGLDGKSKHGKV